MFDLQFVSAETTTGPLGDIAPTEGTKFFIVTVTLHNGANTKEMYRFDTLAARIVTSDGEKQDLDRIRMLKTVRNEDAESDLDPGDSYTCRLVAEVPASVTPAKVLLWQSESHAYLFDVAGAGATSK